ncbi:MAG: ATP-binding protein [Bdellovibrionota bacterium]
MSFDKEKDQLLLALDLGRIGFYDWDVVADSIVYNKYMLEDWGIPNSAAMKLQDAIQYIHIEDRDRVNQLVNDALEKRVKYSTEYRVVRPDGSIVWMEVNGVVKFDGDIPIRFFGTSVNITERKKKEIILEENQEMIRTFADTMPQMAFIADATGAITYFNQRWYDYVSTSGTEGWGWKENIVHHPDDMERTIETWKRSVETGEPYEIDYRLRRFDGEYRWHLGRALPYRNKNGEIVYWYGTNTDIHEERMSLERNRILYDFALELSSGLSPKVISECILDEGNKILNSMGGIVLFADHDKFKVMASRSVPEEFFAQSYYFQDENRMPAKAALVEGKTFFLSSQKEILNEFPSFAKALDKMNVHSLVALPLIVKGKTLASFVFFLDQNKKFPGNVRRFFESLASQAAIAVDHAILFEQQEYQKNELKEALNARDEFFSVASHELKTPLTSMRLNGQILLKRSEKLPGTVSPDSFISNIQQNDKSISKLVRLVDDMLDISRIRTGRITLRKEDFDLCDLLKDIMKRTHLSTETTVTMNDCGQVVGHWDKLRIEQVVSNLLSNAIRYGDGKPVYVSIEKKNERVHLSIRDNGIGIPKEFLDTIFNRYVRGPSGDVQGLGLGLYISRHIIESHGGTIRVVSDTGSGSTFIVELPLSVS